MGIYCLKDSDIYLKQSLDYISKEKEKLKDIILSINFNIIGSNANYIFFKGTENFDKLLYNNYNISIRNCSNYTGLSNKFFRIGIYKKEQNEKFINAINDIKKKGILND